MKPILEVSNVSKKFRIHHLSPDYLSLRDTLTNFFRSDGSDEDFWALDDISFEVSPGESIGIIGRNGAGKSTLLKILSRITPPSKGKITIRGRIASLLEVGTGFHHELTGRENIFFNGSLLGMKKKEIEKKFDEIVDFSGTEKFLDTPLKHYSSGMQLRLAFSVAAFLEPEILVIDEVLAVGDAEFQKKCLGKMSDVSRSGRTILFVSHNLAAVENLCKRAILLDKGRMVISGDAVKVIRTYQGRFSGHLPKNWEPQEFKNRILNISKASISLNGSQPNHELIVDCDLVSSAQHRDVFVAYDVINSSGITVFQAIPSQTPFIKSSSTKQNIKTKIDLPPLIPDHYSLSIWVGSHNNETICWEKEILGFEITDSPMAGRNFPHSQANGFLITPSKIINDL